MRFFVVSVHGDAAGVAWALKQEGNDVSIFLKDPMAKPTLKGIIRQVGSIRSGLNEKPDVVLFDMVGLGREADDARKAGFTVLGGGQWNDRLELDRRFAAKAMETFGIRQPRTFAFSTLQEAIAFAREHERLLVLKPNDNKNTAYTYVPKTQDELLNFMEILARHGVSGRMTLQEYMDGTEVSTEVWYAGGKPVSPPNSTLETKKLFHGDVGPATGCQTSVVFCYPKREPRIVQQSLKKLDLFLEKTGYTGPLDINGIVRNERFYGLEFTPRLGYSAIYALMALLDEPLGDVLQRIASGKDAPMKVKPGYGFSLRVSIPPYPTKPDDPMLARRLYEPTADRIVENYQDGVYPLDVKMGPLGWVTAGVDGVVCECTGYGSSIWEAEGLATGRFRALVLGQKQARLGDGGRRAERRVSELEAQGYEVPPFLPPPERAIPLSPVVSQEETTSEIQTENNELANLLHVRPTAFADPRIKGSG